MTQKLKTPPKKTGKKRRPAPRRQRPFTRTAFLMLAILIMIVVDRFVFTGERPYMDKVRQEGLFDPDFPVIEKIQPEAFFEDEEEETEKVVPPRSAMDKEPSAAEKEAQAVPEIVEDVPGDTASSGFILPKKGIQVHKVELPENRPLWKKNAVRSFPPEGWPRIAVIIDDMGVDTKRSKQVITMKGPLTLAFLPYARDVDRYARAGRDYGHELMIHMPMEAMNGKLDLGGIRLDTSMSPSEIDMMLDRAFGSFGGYVGINNHMGSRLTQDRDYMDMVMERLERRGLLFVDSRTINSSVAADVAGEHNVPFAVRDVFLDHEATPEFVRNSLQQLEYTARYNGYAIAIGHPKDATIQVLKEWLPTLKEKKIALVPISMIVKEEEVRRLSSSLLDAPVQNSLSQR